MHPRKLHVRHLFSTLLVGALLLFTLACGSSRSAVDVAESGAEGASEAADIDIAGINEPRGLRINEPVAQPGYTLFGPILSDTTYLIDNGGQEQLDFMWPELSPADAVEFADTFQAFLASLDEKERRLVDLKLQDYTNDEVAVAMSINERSVRRILNRLQHKMQLVFDGDQ